MGENVKHFSLEEKNDNKNQKQRVQDFKERKRHSIL